MDRGTRLHDAHGLAAEPECRGQIGAQDALPLLGRYLLDLEPLALRGGVVDEDVDATELVARTLHEAAAMSLVLQIARDRDRPTSRGHDQPQGFGRVVTFAAIRNEHVRTFAGEGDGHGATDPLSAPLIKARRPVSWPEPTYDSSPWSGCGSISSTSPVCGCFWRGKGGRG